MLGCKGLKTSCNQFYICGVLFEYMIRVSMGLRSASSANIALAVQLATHLVAPKSKFFGLMGYYYFV